MSFFIIMVVDGKQLLFKGAFEITQIDAEIKRLLKNNEAINIITLPETNRLEKILQKMDFKLMEILILH